MTLVATSAPRRLNLFARERRRGPRPQPNIRPLTAAAWSVDLRDRTEARRVRLLRQGWQQDAFAYSKSVPEVSFAYRFISNAAKRMRVMPRVINPDEPDGEPIPLDEAYVPAQVIESCAQAMASLGLGRIAKSPLMEAASRGLGIPGECWLVGRTNPDSGEEEWSVRSISEVMVMEDEYKLREIPLDPQGQMGWVTLDPATTYVSRMWVPDTEFRILADSPMRALLDTCEELLMLGRDVRAIARSRLAGAGLLKVPNGLSIQTFSDDNTDPMSDSFLGPLAEAMMVPIAEEGVASSVVPVLVRGEPDQLNALQQIVMDRPYSPLAMELRTEAIGRLANGLDVPRAIVLGMEDVNHWGQWQISDDTFRHHLEPGIITCVDALTMAFLRPWLEADNIDPAWVDRMVLWYDPIEIVTHPDRTNDALAVHKLLAISDKALREVTGFTDNDAPSPVEIELRMVRDTKTFPPNVLEALFHVLDPALQIPPIEQSGQIPGMGPKGAIDPTPPPAPGAPPAPPAAPTPSTPPVDGGGSGSGGGLLPAPGPPAAAVGPVATAAAELASFVPAAPPADVLAAFAARAADADRRRRLSRKLTEIDAVLRAKVHTAACASMVRVLERAGAKLRQKANDRKFRDGLAKTAIADTPNALVASVLGRAVVAAMGFPDHHALLNSDWTDLRSQFYDWVESAQRQAVATACSLAGLPATGPVARRRLELLNSHIDDAWNALTEALSDQAESLLYDPMPNAPNPGDVAFNPATVVPVGLVRRVLGIAGGNGKSSALVAALIGDNDSGVDPYSVDPTTMPGASGAADTTTDVTDPSGRSADPSAVSVDFGQVASGSDITDLLTDDGGMTVAAYTWEHNYAGNRPLEGHLDLDGATFFSFTDDVLVNNDDFPDNAYFVPGDHDGCMCDFTTDWVPASEAESEGADLSTADTEGSDDAASADDGSSADDGAGGGDGALSDSAGPDGADAALSGQSEPYLSEDLAAAADDLAASVLSFASDDGALADLADVRADVLLDIAPSVDQAKNYLDDMGVIARPPPLAAGQTGRGGEYDWYYQLSDPERARLRNNGWVVDSPVASSPDQIVPDVARLTGASSPSTDTAMDFWLTQTRIADAGDLLRSRGALPANLDRFGTFNWDALSPNTTYDVTKLFSATKADSAAYLAGAGSDAAAEAASRVLTSNYGPAIYNLSYSDYTAELDRLGGVLDSMDAPASDDEWAMGSADEEAAIARYNELIPAELADADGSYDPYLVWLAARQIASAAGLAG